MSKRPYTMRKRAASREETREKIVEATMRLHEEIGPRATTISAIAERAGVQRLTVYRHFPDETAVFQACTQHWLSLHPPPDPAGWQALNDPRDRLRAALEAFYTYYRGTRAMWVASHRDVADVPALQGPMAAFAAHVTGIADDLARSLAPPKGRAAPVRTTLRHALAFLSWESLAREGLADRKMADLVLAWVDGALADQPARTD